MSTSWDDPSGSENDEFPDLDTLVHRVRRGKPASTAHPPTSAKPPSSVRRRKLVPLSDNTLLKPWAQASDSALQHDRPPFTSDTTTKTKPATRPKIQTRTKKPEPIVQVKSLDAEDDHWESKVSVEVGSNDEASGDDFSEFHDTISISDDSGDDEPRSRYPIKSLSPAKLTGPKPKSQLKASPKKIDVPATGGKDGKRQSNDKTSSRSRGAVAPDDDLASAIDRLRM